MASAATKAIVLYALFVLGRHGSFSASIDSDSYLSAYQLTHGLNGHVENRPTGDRVVFVDAEHQHIDVHPVYVENQKESGGLAPEESFHIVNAQHGHHADHVDVEHHYQPEYHEHYIDVKDSTPLNSETPASGLGNYGTPPVSSYVPPASGIPASGSGYPTDTPVHTYGPPIPMNIPKKMPVYGSPSPVYGPPSPVYGPPAPVYAPVPVYGPPTHHVGVYGPPHHKIPPLVGHEYYEPEPPSVIPDFLQNIVTPHAFLGLLDKIKWFKIDLFTIGKLILKFFIFKKILTFLTILFLLLIIPTLKHKGKESVGMMTDMVDKFGQEDDDDDEDDDEDDDKRSKGRKAKMFINKATDTINALTSHVLESIERFEAKFSANKNETRAQLPSTIMATDLNKLSPSEKRDCAGDNASVYCKSQSVIEKIKTIMPSRDDAETKQTTTLQTTTKSTTHNKPATIWTTTTAKPIKTMNKQNAHNVNLTSKSQLRPGSSEDSKKAR